MILFFASLYIKPYNYSQKFSQRGSRAIEAEKRCLGPNRITRIIRMIGTVRITKMITSMEVEKKELIRMIYGKEGINVR